MWLQLFILVVSAYISYVTQPKPKPPKPPAITDFDFPQIEEHTPQAVIFGDCWTSGWFICGLGNYRTTPIKR